MLGRMGSLSNHLMRGKCPPKGAGMKGQTKAAVRMMDTKAFGCTDNPESVPTPWVERPGQDLNLRGVTHRFSRPAPYRTRRPGQRFILKTKARISVSDLGHKIDLGKAGALLNRLDGLMAGALVKDSRISGFPKREEGDHAGGERQSPREDHRGIKTAGVSEEANDDGTDGEPEVSPEAVDAHGRPAGLRGCEIAHRREVRRVDHRRPESKEQACAGPGEEIVPGDKPNEPDGLDPHSRDDQRLPTNPVARGTGQQLKEPPADRVKAGHEADLLGCEAPSDQEQGEQSPSNPVVQVVHEPALGAREQAPVSPTRFREDGAKSRPGTRSAGLPLRERFRLADEARRQGKARPDRGEPNREWHGTDAIGPREETREERGAADGGIPRELVQARREASSPRSDEVNLAHDRHGPAQTLVDPEEPVCEDDEPPVGRRGKHQEERHGNSDDPADQKDPPPAMDIREVPGGRIRDGLDESEGHEEREDRGARGDAEHLRTEEREQRSLRSDHGADERVHDDQEGELLPVSPEAGHVWRINQGGILFTTSCRAP